MMRRARPASMSERYHMILSPNRNVWRVERAGRAAILSDAGYFGALREALIKARSTIFIVGWDLDSRTRLVGESGKADDGLPEGFADFLGALVRRRPRLTVYLLVWDCSTPRSASRFRRSRCAGVHRASAIASTTSCRSARRTTRRSWSSTMPWLSPAGRT